MEIRTLLEYERFENNIVLGRTYVARIRLKIPSEKKIEKEFQKSYMQHFPIDLFCFHKKI